MPKFTLRLSDITSAIKSVFRRFPLAVLTALLATFCGLWLIHEQDTTVIIKTLITCTLGFPMFIATAIFCEVAPQKSQENTKGVHSKFPYSSFLFPYSFLNLFVLLFLVLYYFWLPDYIEGVGFMPFFRHVLWFVGFILLVTFVPFLSLSSLRRQGSIFKWIPVFTGMKEKLTAKSKTSGFPFWEFNRQLFNALFRTIFYAVCLFAGLAAALGAIDALFEINIDGERYAEIWVLIVGVFSPLFFLNRLSHDSDRLEMPVKFPKEIKIFAQYILVPLLTIYFLILYAYTAKILLTGDWPKGMVSWMIIWFSAVGVLAYFFLYPLRKVKVWVQRFGTVFWAALIPQTGMLFYAIFLRINQYGITENRYLVVMFGVWLLGMALYYLCSQKKNLRVVTISLFCLLFISSFGPWGAFEVSKNCQLDRLERILVQHELLLEPKDEESQLAPRPLPSLKLRKTGRATGKSLREKELPTVLDNSQKKVPSNWTTFVVPSFQNDVPLVDRREIFAISDYLIEYHGAETLSTFFPQSVADYDAESGSRYDLKQAIAKEINIPYTESHSYRNDQYFNVYKNYEDNNVVDITGYEYLIRFEKYRMENEGQVLRFNDQEYTLKYDKNESQLQFWQGERMVEEFRLRPFFDSLLTLADEQGSRLSQVELTVELSGQVFDLKLVFDSVSGERDGESVEVNHWGGMGLVKMNNE